MANLKRDRVNMFKQFLNEEKKKNIDLNKTCLSTRMPRIVMTSKEPVTQNRMSMTQPGIRQQAKLTRIKYETGKSQPKPIQRSELSTRIGHNVSAQANFGALRASSNSRIDFEYRASQSAID